jgi:epoxyqueuosine reductase
MNFADLSKRIHERLAASGFAGKIVSVEHARDLQRQIESARQKGLVDPVLFGAYLSSFAFDIGAVLPGARSLIVVTVPQPQMQVGFEHEGQCHRVIIPPTYDGSTDTGVEKLLGEILRPRGYDLKKIRLPEKLLAACSGLAEYGKNNVTYVREM